MIISDLCDEYKVLVASGRAPEYGYETVNAPYALVMNDEGALVKVRPLGDFSGKKPVNMVTVPSRIPRSSGVVANFLCDNATYLLGYDGKDKSERALKAFDACAELHRTILKDLDSPAAMAMLKFFDYGPQWEAARQIMGGEAWESAQTMNFVLQYEGDEPTMLAGEHRDIQAAWNAYYDGKADGQTPSACSLVSGKLVVPPRTHPKVKGVRGAQPSGASLISFNAPAFCSYNLEQNENAPMSQREAYEYTTALNVMLSDKERVHLMGDDTVIAWAKCGEPVYADTFGGSLFAGLFSSAASAVDDGKRLSEGLIQQAISALAQGKPYDYDGIHLEPDEEFHVLALSPNAARLSVRFYLTNTFGTFAKNIERHYRDLSIVRPQYDGTIFPPMKQLLLETIRKESKNATVSAELAGAMIKAVLNGTAYPNSLIHAVERRIAVEREISPDKAAIIKAYYLRKTTNPEFKEVLQVTIKEDSEYTPYVLGRLFSVYEQIQSAAIQGINTTIRDKYFSSASATPARVFPILGNLAANHLRKTWQYDGDKIRLSKALGELTEKIGDRYPVRLSLEERGAFQLGYYHENQKRFSKNKENLTNNDQGASND